MAPSQRGPCSALSVLSSSQDMPLLRKQNCDSVVLCSLEEGSMDFLESRKRFRFVLCKNRSHFSQ